MRISFGFCLKSLVATRFPNEPVPPVTKMTAPANFMNQTRAIKASEYQNRACRILSGIGTVSSFMHFGSTVRLADLLPPLNSGHGVDAHCVWNLERRPLYAF